MTYKQFYLAIGFIVILILCIYYSTFIWLYERFSAPDSYYSHGFLIPFITGFLVWQKKDRIKAINIESSNLGLVILVFALFVQLISLIAEIYIISEFSLFLVIFGITLYLFGKKIFKEIYFPLLFLIFMFPMPMTLINYITFPMRLVVTKLAVLTLSKFGLTIAQSGFEIILPNTSLIVGTPCSGLRSLITFLVLGAIFAYFLNASIKRKIFLFIMAIPIALFSNLLRVISLSLIAFAYGAEVAVEGFFHNLLGIMIFILAFVLLAILKGVLEWKGSKKDI